MLNIIKWYDSELCHADTVAFIWRCVRVGYHFQIDVSPQSLTHVGRILGIMAKTTAELSALTIRAPDSALSDMTDLRA